MGNLQLILLKALANLAYKVELLVELTIKNKNRILSQQRDKSSLIFFDNPSTLLVLLKRVLLLAPKGYSNGMLVKRV